jgi:hypothetical protein
MTEWEKIIKERIKLLRDYVNDGPHDDNKYALSRLYELEFILSCKERKKTEK